jgi:hypothetical protein
MCVNPPALPHPFPSKIEGAFVFISDSNLSLFLFLCSLQEIDAGKVALWSWANPLPFGLSLVTSLSFEQALTKKIGDAKIAVRLEDLGVL